MGKDRFEFARIVSPAEVAEYLSSLAVGLKRGEVSLESGERNLRLTPPSDLKGKVEIEIGWKRSQAAKSSELNVRVAPRPALG